MKHVLLNFGAKELREGYRRMIDEMPDILEFGREAARNEAESYRDFIVGDVAIGLEPGNPELIKIPRANFKMKHQPEFDGANPVEGEDIDDSELFEVNNKPRDIPKVCAEMAAILSLHEDKEYENEEEDLYARKVNPDTIFFLGHVTIGTTDVDLISEVTGIETPTLTPCEDCTTALDQHENTSRATLYISAGLEHDVLQVRTMDKLKELHQNKINDKETLANISRQSIQESLRYYDMQTKTMQFNPKKIRNSHAYANMARSALLRSVIPIDQ